MANISKQKMIDTLIQNGINPDDLSKNTKTNTYTAYWGFFYRMGRSAEKYAAEIMAKFPSANIIDCNEKFVPFRGGDSVKKGSHFSVTFTL